MLSVIKIFVCVKAGLMTTYMNEKFAASVTKRET